MKRDKRDRKKPLYRKENTKALNFIHTYAGGDYKHDRHTKRDTLEVVKGSMHGKKRRGVDYTPLFKFLLSKVGQSWEKVYGEAITRLDKVDPIFWMVAINDEAKKDMVRIGESTYYSGMFVDDDGNLQLCNPDLNAGNMEPFCPCCTHTFNGKVFGKKYKDV